MAQACLPFFPDGVTNINSNLAFKKEDGKVIYFNWSMPVFLHDENDYATFKMITAQFYINGNVTQSELVQAFGVTSNSVKRAVKLYREKGPKGFYEKRTGRGAAVLTPDVLASAQSMLDDDKSPKEIAESLSLKKDTILKAISSGKLYRNTKKKNF